jgi:hypothetical protein
LEQAQYWWGKAEAQGRKRGRQDIAEGICYWKLRAWQSWSAGGKFESHPVFMVY